MASRVGIAIVYIEKRVLAMSDQVHAAMCFVGWDEIPA